jgi:hypothetical protein
VHLPRAFDRVEQIPDDQLFTKDAADKRESAYGRYMVEWEGAIHEYQYTPFGRMEYRLDRDDVPIRRMGAD